MTVLDMPDRHLERLPTDEELRRRTDRLIAEAEEISLRLRTQTERFAAVVDAFEREVLTMTISKERGDDGPGWGFPEVHR